MRRYLRAANVDWNRFRLDDIKEMVFSEAEDEVFLLRPMDILVVEASGSPAEVGKSVVYRGDPADVRFQNTLLRVRCHSANPEYVQALLLSAAMAGGFREDSRGVSINHLSRARLARWMLPITDGPSQERVAARFLDGYAAVERLRREGRTAQERGEALRRSLLAAAFRGDLTASWRDDRG